MEKDEARDGDEVEELKKRHRAELQEKDRKIFTLTLQLLQIRETEACVTVQLTEPGAIGLTVDELDDGGAWVVAIDPLEQAARHPGIELGMRVVGVGGRTTRQLPFTRVVELIREHKERPLALNLARGTPTAALSSGETVARFGACGSDFTETPEDRVAAASSLFGTSGYSPRGDGRPLRLNIENSHITTDSDNGRPIAEGVPPVRSSE